MEASQSQSYSHDTTAIDPLAVVDQKLKETINNAMEATVPKFDEFITISLTYENKGRWHDVQVTFREYENLLKTGELDGRNVCAVEVFSYPVPTDDEEERKVKMIYDFVQLHTERNPWRFA